MKTRFAVGCYFAADYALVAIVEFGSFEYIAVPAVGEDESGLDNAFRCAGTDDFGVGAVAHNKPQSPHNDGFTGIYFAGNSNKARIDIEVESID